MGYKRKHRITGKTPQHGLAMVEFTITLPFLLIAIAMVAEFGIMFYKYTILTSAVQDGARFLGDTTIHDQTGFTEIRPADETAAKNLIVYGNITASGNPIIDGLTVMDVTISCLNGSTATANGTRCTPDTTYSSLSQISVSARLQYSPVLGSMLSNLTGANINIPLVAMTIHTSS